MGVLAWQSSNIGYIKKIFRTMKFTVRRREKCPRYPPEEKGMRGTFRASATSERDPRKFPGEKSVYFRMLIAVTRP